MKKIKNLLLMLMLVLSLAAPASVPLIGTTQTVAADTKISNKTITLIKGQKKQLKMSGTSKAPKWSSSNKSVAAVTDKGLVTAKKKGSAVITAKLGKNKYTCKITVKNPAAQIKYVWLSATGDKYHKIDHCGRMNPARARKVTLKEAQSRGFLPCSKCF